MIEVDMCTRCLFFLTTKQNTMMSHFNNYKVHVPHFIIKEFWIQRACLGADRICNVSTPCPWVLRKSIPIKEWHR